MNLITICSSAVIVIMLLCFFLGFLRGWKKSLVRFSIVLGCFLASFFLSPVIAGTLMKKFVNGFVLTIFSFRIDFEEIVSGVFNDKNLVEDLFSANSTTADLTSSIMNVLLNVVLFVLMFIVLLLVSLLIYVIIGAVLKRTNTSELKKSTKTDVQKLTERTEEIKEIVDEKKEETETAGKTEIKASVPAAEKPPKDGKYWGLKFVGGFIGLVGGLVICFSFLIPVFGAMNICNKFLKETNASAGAVASAAPANYTCGKLYYTEDDKIGKVETYIEKYEAFKKTYDKSFMGTIFNFTGVSKLGAKSFGYLTNVKTNGLKLNLTNELVSIIKVYNAYKETFVGNTFNLADNGDIENLELLYSYATGSEVAKSYVVEFIPKICERWQNNEKFLGISIPVGEDFKPLTQEILQVLNTNSFDRIDSNIKVLFGAIKVANNNNLILKMQEKTSLVSYLENDEKFIKEEIIQLCSSEDLKTILPKIVNCFMGLAHKELIGTEKDYNTNEFSVTQQQIEQMNVEEEAAALQELTNGILDVYNKTKDAKDANVLTTCLKDIGAIIDSARGSIIISKPLKVFLVDYINSKNFGLEALTNSINKNWEDKTYKFEDMFAAIEEIAKVASNIIKEDGSIDITNLGVTLESILMQDEDGKVKDELKEILNSEVVSDMIGSSDEAVIMTDLLNNLLDCEDTSQIGAGIAAGQKIVNIVNDFKNNDGNVLKGSSETEKKADATEMVTIIGGSDVVMQMLMTASADSNSPITKITESIDTNNGEDSKIIKDAIKDANIKEEYKSVLTDLFTK